MREKPVPLPSWSDPVPSIAVPLGIGTWAWGNKLLWGYNEDDDAALQEAFDVAVDAGITFFDTGDSYGTGKLEGRAEQLLGKFRAEYPDQRRAANVVIGTKLATYPWRVTANSMESALLASLGRLGGGIGGERDDAVECVELMQLHWSAANYAPWQEPGLRAGLAQCYGKGLAKAVGASNYGPKQLRVLHRELAARSVPLASNQVQFSLLSRQPLSSGLLDTCKELGVVPIGYSPLALGLLSGRFNGDVDHDAPRLPPGPRGALFRQILPGTRPLLEELATIAERRGKSVPQVAINWSICKGVRLFFSFFFFFVNLVEREERDMRCSNGHVECDKVDRKLQAFARLVLFISVSTVDVAAYSYLKFMRRYCAGGAHRRCKKCCSSEG